MYRPIQLVLLSAVILSCTLTGAAHDEISESDVQRISMAVQSNLTTLISEKIESFVESVSDNLMDYKNQIASDLNTTTTNMMEELNCMKEELAELQHNMTSGLAGLQSNMTSELAAFCSFDSTTVSPSICGGKGWRHVVYLNMTDPNTNCPSGWKLSSYSGSKRTCSKVSTFPVNTCDSVTFPVNVGSYTRVCGRIVGYQYWNTNAFSTYNEGSVTSIDGAYVTGVSLTHGSPRQHIWTFAAGNSETTATDTNNVCPCDATRNINIPPFVSGDFFCESGWNSGSSTLFYPDDPLWDGKGCTTNSRCCSFNNPPYFIKELPNTTTDYIEARLCSHYGPHGDTPIELIELYVQ